MELITCYLKLFIFSETLPAIACFVTARNSCLQQAKAFSDNLAKYELCYSLVASMKNLATPKQAQKFLLSYFAKNRAAAQG